MHPFTPSISFAIEDITEEKKMRLVGEPLDGGYMSQSNILKGRYYTTSSSWFATPSVRDVIHLYFK